MRKIFFPIAANSGFSRSTGSSLPPTMNTSVPSRAPIFDPVIGASTQVAPFFPTRSANFTVADGEIVLESAMIMPSVSDASTPSAPKITPSTASVSDTQSHTTSAPCAAPPGGGATPAPPTRVPRGPFPPRPSCPALDRIRVGYAEPYHFRALRRRPRRRRDSRSLHEVARGSIPHRHFVSRLHQVRGHSVTHDSQPHKRNSHADFSFVLKKTIKGTLSD